ncbi:hypothetical protein [Sinomonas atrocyanea]|jgi:hypothetical protein|uniref:hypothetical protein n=1 Tax=Sinomonas atrocyanea TaxID=37927 RepID=UPI00278A0714|nr:hypothetical protein [Sinomonas atrocyanea]MDQ0260727.1 hypothetical protein [Sinomonas atrocyanea]MDR6622290.1 hypothetical protein [Sinomonas atrocyanea]
MKNAPARPPRHHDRPAAARNHSPGPFDPADSGRPPRDPVRPQLPSHGTAALDPQAVRRREQTLEELRRAGLDMEQALAQISRLEAGDVWSG